MSSYHTSTFGSFAPRATAVVDMDGYIHTSTAAVLSGSWDGDMDPDEAVEIAATNRRAVRDANNAIEELNAQG